MFWEGSNNFPAKSVTVIKTKICEAARAASKFTLIKGFRATSPPTLTPHAAEGLQAMGGEGAWGFVPGFNDDFEFRM